LYGYDTAKLVLTLIHNGATTRETLMRALANVTDYPSLHSKIGFSSKRVNSWLQMLQYTSNRIQRLAELDVR
jgi:hypothetical protein